MLLIRAPIGRRAAELEFRHAREAHIVRPTNMGEMSDDDFEKFFFIRHNEKGVTFERWRHVHGCGRFFNAVRNTVTDEIMMTYRAGEPKPDIQALEQNLALTQDAGVSGSSVTVEDDKS